MPQIPLFVSSARSGGASNGSFSVDFQPPLEIPETATNATIEVQQMSVPYTTPNISKALNNNTVVVQIPNAARDNFVFAPGSTTVRANVVLTIPDGLYTLDALQLAINQQVNMNAHLLGAAPFLKRSQTVTHKTVAVDGTDGAGIDAAPEPDWLSFLPDFVTNRLRIQLSYTHASIVFTDTRSTLGPTLGFSSDVLTTTESFNRLTTESVTVDLLYKADSPGAVWAQTSLELPAVASGYTVTKIRDDLNSLAKAALAIVGLKTVPYTGFIASLSVVPNDADTVTVKLAYANAALVKLRGDASDTVSDLSGLAVGQLRAGLSNPSYTESAGVDSIGNPYATNAGYLNALRSIVYTAAGVASYTSITEQHVASFLSSIGATAPGSSNTVPIIQYFYPAGSPFASAPVSTWTQVSDMHAAAAQMAAHIDSTTEIGLAVEPIVQGPRDTSGKVSGTLARFVIPGGAEPGDVLAFESANPTRVSIQSFAGQDINRLTFRLVDQHNDVISDLSGEHYSAVVLISYE